MHWGTQRAVEVLGELGHVGHGSDDTEFTRAVHVSEYSRLQSFGPVLIAPDGGRTDPEHLLGCVVKSGKSGLHAVAFFPVVVGEIRFFDASIVSYVFPLRVATVDLRRHKVIQKDLEIIYFCDSQFLRKFLALEGKDRDHTHFQSDFFHRVITVLIDNALCSLEILLFC